MKRAGIEPVTSGLQSGAAYSAWLCRFPRPGTLADYRRWGRITGYQASFTGTAHSALEWVLSTASAYKSVRGAADSLHASFRAAARPQQNGLPSKRVSLGGATIGHEARLYKTDDEYALMWRYRTVKADIRGAGVSGTFDVPPESLIALAKKQQRRIESALR